MKREILYVDDEPDNRVVFEATFEDDFHILTAGNGREALQVLERSAVPVVVADQRMPAMSGVELFEVMRQRHPYIQRVLLTGYSDPDAMVAAINRGQVFHYVKKPWDRQTLFSILVRAIEAHDLALTNDALTTRLIASERCALLGRATARIAHEMGNQLCLPPLIEWIESEYAHQEELVCLAGFARETHQRLVALVEEIKTFMRCEQEAFERTPISLAEMVRGLLSLLRFDKSLPHERITFEARRDATVLGNKVKLQQVLVNLVRNAAHAIRQTPDGWVRLVLDRREPEALLTVEDNGQGMTPDIQARIWEPFFTTKGREGNGLGLDISRRIIERHEGRILCESAPAVGTIFQIRLPAWCEPRARSADAHAAHALPLVTAG